MNDDAKSKEELIAELRSLRRELAEASALKKEHARILEQLEEVRERFELFMRHLPGAAFINSADGRVVFANQVAAEIVERDSESLPGKHLSEIFPSPVAESLLDQDLQILSAKEPCNFEETVPGPEGPRRWLTCKFPIIGKGRQPLVGGISIDITSQEENLQRLEMMFQAIETSPALVMITDAKGIIEYVNPRHEEVTGYRLEELHGRNATELGSGQEEQEQEIWRTLSSGRPWTGEFKNIRKDGDTYYEMASISGIRDEHGETTHYIKVAEDISERKMAEQVLRENDQLKNEFIATAAHELRTPLTAVIGFTELLLDGHVEDAQERQHYLAIILERGRALAAIVDDLLDLSRIHAGKQLHLQCTDTDLGSLIEQEVQQFAENCPGHQFRCRIDPSCCLLPVDRGKITQVLDNLLSNACKYSPEESLISVEVGAEKGHLQISVMDEGNGMTEEQLGRVFDKFYRADASDTAIPGLGLGMSIARSIVEAHGGRIEVESEIGLGSTFRILLPL